MPKNVICLWYDGTAEEAANFYAKTFPDSRVTAIHRAPGDYPDGQLGDVLTVEFTVVVAVSVVCREPVVKNESLPLRTLARAKRQRLVVASAVTVRSALSKSV